MKKIDITGRRFGYLVVLGEAPRDKNKRLCWRVFCSACGKNRTMTSSSIRASTSCGCRRKTLRHGAARKGNNSPEYRSWSAMVTRCTNSKVAEYKRYGGRGIRVCPRWRKSFEAFLADMGKRPTSRHTLDRIDNDGHYEPGNTRWATPREQGQNRRTTRYLEHNGERLAVAEWARRKGISASTIYSRLRRGWSVRASIEGKE